jgi:hypothetical protein
MEPQSTLTLEAMQRINFGRWCHGQSNFTYSKGEAGRLA